MIQSWKGLLQKRAKSLGRATGAISRTFSRTTRTWTTGGGFGMLRRETTLLTPFLLQPRRAEISTMEAPLARRSARRSVGMRVYICNHPFAISESMAASVLALSASVG